MAVLGGGAVSDERGTSVLSSLAFSDQMVYAPYAGPASGIREHPYQRGRTRAICYCAAPLSSELGTHKAVKALFWASFSTKVLIDSGLGRDTRQEDVEGSPTQSRISPIFNGY